MSVVGAVHQRRSIGHNRLRRIVVDSHLLALNVVEAHRARTVNGRNAGALLPYLHRQAKSVLVLHVVGCVDQRQVDVGVRLAGWFSTCAITDKTPFWKKARRVI